MTEDIPEIIKVPKHFRGLNRMEIDISKEQGKKHGLPLQLQRQKYEWYCACADHEYRGMGATPDLAVEEFMSLNGLKP